MPDKRIALVTGANQGVGLQAAKELVANGVTVLSLQGQSVYLTSELVRMTWPARLPFS